MSFFGLICPNFVLFFTVVDLCQNPPMCPSLLPPTAACGVICLHFILLWHFSHLHFAWAFETEGGIYVGIKNRTFAPSLCISVMLDIMLTISIHSTGYENSKHVIQNRSTRQILHSCNFMIPAPLFYEVNDPLLQVCYKPKKHVAKHAHLVI